MKIAVIDGQGGGMGRIVIEKLRKEFGKEFEILALGTNAFATANMVKAGASEGASGESAICFCCNNVKLNVIIGPIGIICPNSMLGELTPKMAEAIFNSECTKYIIPLNKHGLYVPGVSHLQIQDFIDDIIHEISKLES